jgi:hypothetical protein
LEEFVVSLPKTVDADGDMVMIETTKKWDGTEGDFKIEVD